MILIRRGRADGQVQSTIHQRVQEEEEEEEEQRGGANALIAKFVITLPPVRRYRACSAQRETMSMIDHYIVDGRSRNKKKKKKKQVK